MEIKVNDYIRTIDGYIRKVKQVNRKGSYDGLCHGAYNVDTPYKYSQGISSKKIKSHSPNIIDLIEVGDYVNGKKVLETTGKMLTVSSSNIGDNRIFEYMIKSIVTHEQFNQVKYEA